MTEQSHRPLDVVTLGESMVAFLQGASPHDYRATVIGGESNVAVSVTQLGHRACWVTRLGDDELGTLVEEWVCDRGVEVLAVRDPDRRTGIALKEIHDGRTRVRYYRRDSAASALSPADAPELRQARWLHLTGVTPALSDSAHQLVDHLLTMARSAGCHTSFDINYRPLLWSGPDEAADLLLPLARKSDVVLIGDDEAQALIGSTRWPDVAGAILQRADQELVLKRGPGAASAGTLDSEVTVPSARASVVDLTGAGDAFAAGYLVGYIREWEVEDRLRLGHIAAARVISERADVAPHPDPHEVSALADRAGVEKMWKHLRGEERS